MKILGWALMLSDWYFYKKRKYELRNKDTHPEERPGKSQRKDSPF
jgi:hypothetical protein